MCFIWTLCIATLVASEASSASTKTNSIEKNNNESILPHHLNVEAEERGNVREILKAFDALPEEIAVLEQAMARSATEAEKVASNEKAVNRISDEEAESIMQKLWSEYKKEYLLSTELPPLNRLNPKQKSVYEPLFLAFVRKDSKRKEEWIKWQNHESGKNKAAHEVPASTSTMVQATTGTSKMLSDKEAESIYRNLWMEFNQKSPLPDLAGHHPSASSRNMIKSEFSKFLAEDPGRLERYKEWQNWYNTKEGSKLVLPDISAAAKQPMTHATTEDAKADFDEKWKSIPVELRERVKRKYSQLQKLPALPIDFGLNRRNTEAVRIKAEPAQEIPSFSPAMVHATAETEKTFSDKEAADAMRVLWNQFRLNYVEEYDHVPTFEDLGPDSRKTFRPAFLEFVTVDLDRKRIFERLMKWQSQPPTAGAPQALTLSKKRKFFFHD